MNTPSKVLNRHNHDCKIKAETSACVPAGNNSRYDLKITTNIRNRKVLNAVNEPHLILFFRVLQNDHIPVHHTNGY
jgi:hypothetical protein